MARTREQDRLSEWFTVTTVTLPDPNEKVAEDEYVPVILPRIMGDAVDRMLSDTRGDFDGRPGSFDWWTRAFYTVTVKGMTRGDLRTATAPIMEQYRAELFSRLPASVQSHASRNGGDATVKKYRADATVSHILSLLYGSDPVRISKARTVALWLREKGKAPPTPTVDDNGTVSGIMGESVWYAKARGTTHTATPAERTLNGFRAVLEKDGKRKALSLLSKLAKEVGYTVQKV